MDPNGVTFLMTAPLNHHALIFLAFGLHPYLVKNRTFRNIAGPRGCQDLVGFHIGLIEPSSSISTKRLGASMSFLDILYRSIM